MNVQELKQFLPETVINKITATGITELRPAQQKAIEAGLFTGKSLLICTPTASGKTFVAELTAAHTILNHHKALYIVPLVALATEKAKDFKHKWQGMFNIALSIGDFDAADSHLGDYDFILCTAEKLDSLLRHHSPWIQNVGCVIVDEIHLLNDVSRGPTLEILITLLKQIVPTAQIVGLSATIGNPDELAAWLNAELIRDDWRPVPLHKGVYHKGTITFQE